ncbi:uncharacterized protein [Panulirus ornatus]|uniref:uncharacterized protein n=1 Tax=Panulirus ornatus TaxID=150431 RepID=UPI003A8C2201
MWSSGNKSMCSSFLVMLFMALLTYSCDGKTDTQLCSEESDTNDESTFICSCHSINEIIIIQDNKITYGNIQITVPNTTKHWRIGECSAVHLSGPTLTSLKNIHTLQLHHIDQIHIAYDFLLQYKTQLQVLQVSHSKFAALEGSLNIHAHKIKNIVLDNLIWKGQFNLVILTQDDQNLDLIAIKNSTIEVLGEINVSSKYVHTFVLENNNISTILTGAIFHKSNETNILGNYIDQLNFLSLDTDTRIFTLEGNTIKFLSLETLVVNNAILIQVINNSFFHIDRYALTWLRLKSEKGLMVFSSNHFHKHVKGSLIFNLATYNEKLVIKNNILHTTFCNCSSAKLIETMTEANEDVIPSFKLENDKTNKLFTDSSFCLDEERKLSKISRLCANNESYWSWGLPVIVIVITLTCGLLVKIVLKQYTYKLKYERLQRDTERDIF